MQISTTTEVYKTLRDIGVFVDGSIAFGFKSEDLIEYGPIKGDDYDRGSDINVHHMF